MLGALPEQARVLPIPVLPIPEGNPSRKPNFLECPIQHTAKVKLTSQCLGVNEWPLDWGLGLHNFCPLASPRFLSCSAG